ncbi:sulfite exporter TauE/SafE family protein [bacterium]|nr:sulfite exporter TauE/SafE family protein [bacterium]
MFLIGAASALWLGILTSISPCPLATNIAAISFIGRHVGDARRVFISGIAYTLGRMITYLVVGIVVVMGALSIPGVANFLQESMNKILGPLLIVVGMFLLELIRLNISGPVASSRFLEKAGKGGILGAGLLGITFALSFCPISAALFFGSLIPLAVQHQSRVEIPSLYGIGTALPVVIFAILTAFGARFVGKAFDSLRKIERWARSITGVVFILVGIYYTLAYIFKVL